MKQILYLSLLALAAFGGTYAVVKYTQREQTPAPQDPPPGMVEIPSGEFTMGSGAPYAYRAEGPAHRVRVDGFWMDETDVTNAQFRAFVEATGYVTTAEEPVNAEEILRQLPPGTPPPAKENLLPGSLVFTPTQGPVPLQDFSQWW